MITAVSLMIAKSWKQSSDERQYLCKGMLGERERRRLLGIRHSWVEVETLCY